MPGAPAVVMRIRDEGRVMFFGVARAGEVLGYTVGRTHPLERVIHGSERLKENGVFVEISADFEVGALNRSYQRP